MPALYTTTYTAVFSGENVYPAFPQYTAFSLTANVTLSWPGGFQNLNMITSPNMDITPDVAGWTVTMPDATGAGVGFACEINNPGNFSFNLLDNDGNLIITIPAGNAKKIWLINNSTSAGNWRTFPGGGGGGGAVTSVNAASASDNLLITGTPGLPIIGAGTINFALAKDLLRLSSFAASTGFAVRTAADTWALRDINGTAGQITVTNPDGVAGNITIGLSLTLAGLTSIGVGNLSLSGNTIASTNNNGEILLNPQGTGVIGLGKDTELRTGSKLKFFNDAGTHYISFKAAAAFPADLDLTWPVAVPVVGQLLSYTAPNTLGWASVPIIPGGPTTINAVARYANTGGGLANSVLILDDPGNASGLLSCQIGDILIGGVSSPATLVTLIPNQDFTLSPNGAGTVLITSDALLKKSTTQSRLRLYDNTDTRFAGLMANPAMTNNFTWTLPATGNTAGYFFTDATNSLSVQNPTVGAVGAIGDIPVFNDTTGNLFKDSGINISTGGDISRAGGMSLSATGANLTLGAGTTAQVLVGGASTTLITLNNSQANTTTVRSYGVLNVLSTSGPTISTLKLFNLANTFGINLQAPSGLGANATFVLPSAASAGALLSDVSGNFSITNTNSNITTFSNTTDSSSTTNGALICSGGLGIAKKGFFGDRITSPSIAFSSTDGIIGTTTNNSATAGSVGEYVSGNATGVSFTSGIAKNFTSISLTAGDWEVSGAAQYNASGTMTVVAGSISTTSNTINSTTTAFTQLNLSGWTSGGLQAVPVASTRISLSGTTTVYLVGQSNFSSGTVTGNGYMQAWRIR
jgi:hypothetical protein